jgi:O-acetyl-ADP-ribose deacetylase (regulator of RNase III)
MKLILVDPKITLCSAWKEYFGDMPDYEVRQGYFEQVADYDCMVSAANSFGLMDGGVDLAIIRFFGYELEARVQKRILAEWRGEQPVGTSMIVETMHATHPFIAHTPTMRIPMDITHTDNVYKAMWAMLVAVDRHNQSSEYKINAIACPGLGTATGQMPAKEAARQMALAYQNFLNPPRRIDWNYASERHIKIRFGGYDGFRFPMD